MEHKPDPAWVAKNKVPNRPWTKGQTKYYKKYSDSSQHSAIPIDQCLTQPSPEKLPLVDGNKHRLKAGQYARVRDLGTPSLKGMSPTNLFPQSSGNFMEVEAKYFKSQWGWKAPRKQSLQDTTGTDAHINSETVAASTDSIWMGYQLCDGEVDMISHP